MLEHLGIFCFIHLSFERLTFLNFEAIHNLFNHLNETIVGNYLANIDNLI
jgi:hypothetical protein